MQHLCFLLFHDLSKLLHYIEVLIHRYCAIRPQGSNSLATSLFVYEYGSILTCTVLLMGEKPVLPDISHTNSICYFHVVYIHTNKIIYKGIESKRNLVLKSNRDYLRFSLPVYRDHI